MPKTRFFNHTGKLGSKALWAGFNQLSLKYLSPLRLLRLSCCAATTLIPTCYELLMPPALRRSLKTIQGLPRSVPDRRFFGLRCMLTSYGFWGAAISMTSTSLRSITLCQSVSMDFQPQLSANVCRASRSQPQATFNTGCSPNPKKCGAFFQLLLCVLPMNCVPMMAILVVFAIPCLSSGRC
jgi:hypothetical protein